MINWALAAVPVASLTGILPGAMKVSLMFKAGKPDNRKGRGNLEEFKTKMSKEDYEKAVRASQAEANFHENFPFYLGAVLAANYSNVPKDWTATMALIWPVLRIFYNGFYIYGTTEFRSNMRSMFWILSLCTSWAMYIRAALNAW
mmetsp:Transcript_1055/g.3280  ORF Transcript_1055/g.3280 Transcript_1055/m.3280 type:complete len:145 (+) Transcript_1055:223-657(+)|eukprot:CAMPEP_0198722868 /NCGR_PEP_ID=MMETSP1475-20131203/465_1 /TAXON_ID= ORGANISM="Unidentified sp., Strain CCMP1999" /NCGR_SAMPLE_ID=MMETSP1475 /ASSEMBLY_ACC=CAM_ASM_001111 /LENGTH=144 /DNA_ID=CAMNT_0044483805 /DNA_START=207 /DNA_END=638 /DNA_ORIENTATION=+